MTSTARLPRTVPAAPAPRRPHLRVVTPTPRPRHATANAAAYTAGLAIGAVLVALTTALSQGPGAGLALAFAVAAACASVVLAHRARIARGRLRHASVSVCHTNRTARVAAPQPTRRAA